MKAVSNATPLIFLGKLGQLGLLSKIYDDVLVPGEVYKEVVINGLRLGSAEAKAVDFLVQRSQIQVVQIGLPDPLPTWAAPIDAGELEVILLALQKRIDLVLIDNLHARKAARKAGVTVKGTLGVLLDAFRQKHLTLNELELLIHTVKIHPDIWISDILCDQVLTQAKQETGA
jgi:predicted nucleic acid-binding protein